MSTTERTLDGQGRVSIPKHIQDQMGLHPGNKVAVQTEEDGSIRIKVVGERCDICGASVEGKHHAEITAGTARKLICFDCSQKILKNVMR